MKHLCFRTRKFVFDQSSVSCGLNALHTNWYGETCEKKPVLFQFYTLANLLIRVCCNYPRYIYSEVEQAENPELTKKVGKYNNLLFNFAELY